MPIALIHPRDFSARYGLARTPSKGTLRHWRKSHDFPNSVGVPRGFYRADEVDAWFASRQGKAA